MLWNIFRYNPATRETTPLGRVRADNHPRAVLNAFKKWRIKDVKDQRRIGAERVVPATHEPLTLSTDELTQLRTVISAVNTVLRG